MCLVPICTRFLKMTLSRTKKRPMILSNFIFRDTGLRLELCTNLLYRRIQDPVKHLKWSLFSQKASFWMFGLWILFYVDPSDIYLSGDKFFISWRKYLPTNNADEAFLPTKNFTISKIFWNWFRGLIFTQVAQKYRRSSVWLHIWPTVNTFQ